MRTRRARQPKRTTAARRTLLRSRLRQALRDCCDLELDFRFDPARPVVRLHEPTYGLPEVWEVADSLLTTRITMGRKVFDFERRFRRRFGAAHAVMVNSGSSANLLAVAALANPVTGDRLSPGDEVIVPALCWSTSVWPLIQHQLVPVVVDMDPATLNMDPGEVERAIGPRTRGLLTVPIYGNPCAMDHLMKIVDRRGLVLIEDCCESLGATFGGRPVGSFGRAGTFSFYFSHHITTMEGGMCVTGDDELSETMRVLRAHGWVRDTLDPGRYARRHPGFHPRFLFTNLGYNLRPTELAGGFGVRQLARFSRFLKIRRDNASYWRRALAPYAAVLRPQAETAGGRSTWFGFPLTVQRGAPFTRDEITAFLESRGIETRPLSAGNIAAQPGLKLYPHRVVGDLAHASHSLASSFTWGNHQEVDTRARGYVALAVREFLAARGLA
jgi:CDP-6-deoxy-D-xylo-4-hexulose-3-dehydrase